MSAPASQVRGKAIAALIIALMLAGFGTLVYPRGLETMDWIVCPGAPRLEVRPVQYSYHGPGEFTLNSTCSGAAGSGDRTFPALGAMFAHWFVIVFVGATLWGASGSPRERRPALPPGTPIRLDPETRARVMELLRSMKLIQAIKEIRTATGLGLKESKDVAEALMKDPDAYPSAEPQPQPVAAAAQEDEDAPSLAKLRELKRMRDDGLITTGEYEAKKAELLARM
ncbi:MAG TPA: SHOCT domain-containing protein [Longimicrobium sp.]|nr:SHOCT domain-containing protein [Longimicrobium sp.]